jgi:hypothetical protein
VRAFNILESAAYTVYGFGDSGVGKQEGLTELLVWRGFHFDNGVAPFNNQYACNDKDAKTD